MLQGRRFVEFRRMWRKKCGVCGRERTNDEKRDSENRTNETLLTESESRKKEEEEDFTQIKPLIIIT